MAYQELIIKNGQFYRNGKLEKPIFGNKEQLDALRRWNNYSQELENGEVVPDIEFERNESGDNYVFTGEVSFRCACNQRVVETKQSDDDSNFDVFINLKLSCLNCMTKYIIKEHEDFSELVVKKL